MDGTQFKTGAQGGFLPAVQMSAGSHRPQYTPAGLGTQTFAGRAHGTPAFMGQVQLGQTAQTWYNRARAAMERFQILKAQVQGIDNQAARNTIVTWLGRPGIEGTPEWRYAGVSYNYTTSVQEEGVQAYDKPDRQGRVEDLESFNDQLSSKIALAQVTYGSRPVTPVTPGVPAPVVAGPDLTLPIVGVGLLVAAAVVLG